LALSELAVSAPSGWTTIQLHSISSPPFDTQDSCYRIASALFLRRTPLPPGGFSAAAYMISREGALRFLAYAQQPPRDTPLISDWLLWHFPTAYSFTIYPSIVLAGASKSSLHNFGVHARMQRRTLVEGRLALCVHLNLLNNPELCVKPFEKDVWSNMTDLYPYATQDYSMWHSYSFDDYYVWRREASEARRALSVLRQAHTDQLPSPASPTHFKCEPQEISLGGRADKVPLCQCATIV